MWPPTGASYRGGVTTCADPTRTEPLSRLLRISTTQVHDEAEHSTFMADLLAGRADREAFVRLTEQLALVYAALEDVVDAHADDPVVAAVDDRRLRRLPALAADLDALRGPGWRDDLTPLPATGAYVERLRGCAGDPARLVAHHYTRYLGDLSGGQVIPTMLTRHYGVEEGLSFYRFDELGKIKPYKDAYRAALDALPLDAAARARAADEAVEAFRRNTALFADLEATS